MGETFLFRLEFLSKSKVCGAICLVSHINQYQLQSKSHHLIIFDVSLLMIFGKTNCNAIAQ